MSPLKTTLLSLAGIVVSICLLTVTSNGIIEGVLYCIIFLLVQIMRPHVKL